jgi:hypothetical protein
VTVRTISNLEREGGAEVSFAIRRLAMAEIRLELVHDREANDETQETAVRAFRVEASARIGRVSA